ncbi:hypothetical protein SAY86_025707 [Trapa natans]|uniref:Uncharacterized protein n=1 Tax=Trapa natans TaxID=22666 RepID=A0AAN7KJY8_TRANT|nr:hypothetical protein SAY86_025707 [Trapa natans]
MDIPVINRISDFDAGIASIQGQSLLSLSGVTRASRAYSFWKWGALILAILASFSAIIRRIRILVIRLQSDADSLRESLIQRLDDGDESLDETSSLSSSSSDCYDEDDEEEVEDGELIVGSPVEGPRRTNEIFQVKGTGFDFFESPWQSRSSCSCSSGLRRRRSMGNHFSEFASGKSVVKLWDNLRFGLGLELDGDALISRNHTNPSQSTSSSSSSMWPSLVLEKASAASLGLWDTRAASRRPAILAEWGPQVEKSDTVGRGGVGKVFLKSGGELAAVGDLRKVRATLDNVTEADVGTWWDADADAVIVEDEFVGGGDSAGNGHSSAVTRCCDAVRSYFLI